SWHLLEWDTHRGVQKLVADLNRMYQNEPSLHELDFDPAGFEWIDCHNHNDSVLVYLRRARDPEDFTIIACNFTPVVREGYRVGVPRGGWYQEIFNSDASCYGGSNVGNHPGVEASSEGHHLRPFSLTLRLPPLSVSVFKPSRG